MIRFRVRLDEGDPAAPSRTPSASIHAYESASDRRAAMPVPAFVRDLLGPEVAAPDVISSAAPHAEPEDLEEPEDAAPSPEGDEPNVWASRIVITTERPIPGFTGLPFTWEIVCPGRADTAGGSAAIRSPVVRVVAAPGVRVLLMPPASDDEPIMRVDVIRVQDPTTVPALGEAVDASLLLTGNGVGMHRGGTAIEYVEFYQRMHMARFASTEAERDEEAIELVRTGLRNRRISVMPQRDGALIFDNRTERMLQIRVRVLSRAFSGSDSESDIQGRFGYWINQSAGDDEPAVTVAATSAVEVTQFHFGAFEAGDAVAPDLTDVQRDARPFALLRVPDFDSVPLPGRRIEPPDRPSHDDLTMSAPRSVFHAWEAADIEFVDPPPELSVVLVRAGADIMVSLIPVVGDALDIAELGVALVTGRDRWGQRVGLLDLSLMAMGAVMPFVNRRELQLSLFAGQAAVGGAMLAPGYLPAEDEGP